MFDPTAFDNMKVVIEGALYDLDLEGNITILDRNDVINLAKLSRSYEVTFAEKKDDFVTCTFKLTAKLENLSAELLSSSLNTRLTGTHLSILFTMKHHNKIDLHRKIKEEFTSIWGSDRTIQHAIIVNPFSDTDLITKEVTIEFNRLIQEDQIDDLVLMVDYIMATLNKLNQVLK